MKPYPTQTAVIFASRPVTAGMRTYLPQDCFIATADAGWHSAVALGYAIDLAVGDFDSSQPPQTARELLVLPAEKDDTDTQFAARHLLQQGFRSFILLGALGGRLDHQHANFQTMLYLARRGAQVCALSEDTHVYCMGPGKHSLAKDQWNWLSVFALGGAAAGVCLAGVKYPLQNAVLQPDYPVGVSNEFASHQAEIACGEGFLLVMVTK